MYHFKSEETCLVVRSDRFATQLGLMLLCADLSLELAVTYILRIASRFKVRALASPPAGARTVYIPDAARHTVSVTVSPVAEAVLLLFPIPWLCAFHTFHFSVEERNTVTR